MCFCWSDWRDRKRAVTIWWQYNMYFVNPSFLYLFNCFASSAPYRKLILLVLFQILYCLRTLTKCIMKGLVPSNEFHDLNNKIQQTIWSDVVNADSVVKHTQSLTVLNNYWSLAEIQFAQPTTMTPAETSALFWKIIGSSKGMNAWHSNWMQAAIYLLSLCSWESLYLGVVCQPRYILRNAS